MQQQQSLPPPLPASTLAKIFATDNQPFQTEAEQSIKQQRICNPFHNQTVKPRQKRERKSACILQ